MTCGSLKGTAQAADAVRRDTALQPSDLDPWTIADPLNAPFNRMVPRPETG